MTTDYDECISLDLYTRTQENVLAVLPYLTAPLSLAGSSLILWAIWYDRKVLLSLVYHRLIFAMSLLDWFASFGMTFLGSWAVPEDYAYGRPGRGTTQTCAASGVFLSLVTGAMAYNAFLAVSFVMTIRWEWKERRIACCMEPFAHFFGFLMPVVNAVTGAIHDCMNPVWALPGWCWYSDSPPFCSSNNTYCMTDRNGSGELVLIPTECDRGAGGNGSSETINIGLVLFLWFVIVICMILIITKVFRMERRIQQQYGDVTASLNRTKETGNQAFLYIAVFVVTFFPVSVVQFLTENANNPIRSNKTIIFIFALLTKTLTPIGGFFNAFIYFRKRFPILLKEGQSLFFLTQLPVIGPWLVERQKRQRHRPNTSTAAMSSSNTSRHYSSVAGLRAEHERQQSEPQIGERQTSSSHLPKQPYPDPETLGNNDDDAEINNSTNKQTTDTVDNKENDDDPTTPVTSHDDNENEDELQKNAIVVNNTNGTSTQVDNTLDEGDEPLAVARDDVSVVDANVAAEDKSSIEDKVGQAEEPV